MGFATTTKFGKMLTLPKTLYLPFLKKLESFFVVLRFNQR